MNKSILALSLALASFGAFAQVAADAGAQAVARAETAPITLNNVFGSTPASTFGYQFGNSMLTQKGIPVSSPGFVQATQPVWKCSGAGDGGALQLKDFGLALSLGGNDKNICAVEFRMAVAGFVVELEAKGLQSDQFVIAHGLACTDDVLADAFEKTKNMKCSENTGASDRKARWARERQANDALAGTQPSYSVGVAQLNGTAR